MLFVNNDQLVLDVDARSRIAVYMTNHAESPLIAQLGDLSHDAFRGGFFSGDGRMAVSGDASSIQMLPAAEGFYPYPPAIPQPVNTSLVPLHPPMPVPVIAPHALSYPVPALQPYNAPTLPQIKSMRAHDCPEVLTGLTGQFDFIFLCSMLGLDKIDFDNINTGIFIRTFVENTIPTPPGCIGLPVRNHLGSFLNPNDGANSLREAFNYAQMHGAGATLSFTDDFEIRLSSPLTVTQNIIIDAGTNKVTLIGPETEPMFRVSESRLTLKKLSLMSDCPGDGGGILDVDTPGRMDLFSVRDGGKAETLWRMSGKFELILDGDSQLHRLVGTKGASVKIMAGSSLEDASFAGKVPGDNLCDVYGVLKNASVDNGIIRPFNGGKCENITAKCSAFEPRPSEIHSKPGCVHLCSNGAINGMKTEFGSVFSYKQSSVLTGTVSIGSAAVTAGHVETSIVGPETDFIIDLTGRTENSTFYYPSLVGDFGYIVNDPISFPLIERLKDFAGARSYTIRIKEDQALGVYNLAGDAEDFTTPFSLAVGDTVYTDVLTVGKKIPAGDRTCFLALQKKKKSPLGGTTYVLVLMIEAPSGEADIPADEEGDMNGEETFVIFEGIIDGRGTFTFQKDRILYNHLEWDYPADVTINGKQWKNLNEPFELGFEPAFSTAKIADKIGRDTIELKAFQDRAELFIDDWEDSLARYRVFLRFKKTQDE